MRLIAIVRASKVGPTKEALAAIGLPGLTCAPCLGRGKRLLDPSVLSLLMASGELPMTAAGEAMTESSRLIPKRLFEVVVEDGDAERAAQAIISANSTGRPGDGRIFAVKVGAAYNVRTGEGSGL